MLITDCVSAVQDEQVPKLFEWCDGPLVQAMKEGAMFLVDEISLADDSVLERLNSVLEPERTLVLAEKGDSGGSEVAVLVAHNAFKIVATMNPGGDFGKKEVRDVKKVHCVQLNLVILNSVILNPHMFPNTHFQWIFHLITSRLLRHCLKFSSSLILIMENFFNLTCKCTLSP